MINCPEICSVFVPGFVFCKMKLILSRYRSNNSQFRSKSSGEHLDDLVKIFLSDPIFRKRLEADFKEPVSCLSRCHNVREEAVVSPGRGWIHQVGVIFVVI